MKENDGWKKRLSENKKGILQKRRKRRKKALIVKVI
jgi:hypothetical protein